MQMLTAPVSLLKAAGWISLTQLLVTCLTRRRWSFLLWGHCSVGPWDLLQWEDKEKLICCDRVVFFHLQGLWDEIWGCICPSVPQGQSNCFRGWGLQRFPHEFYLLKQAENLNDTVNKINLSVQIPLSDEQSWANRGKKNKVMTTTSSSNPNPAFGSLASFSAGTLACIWLTLKPSITFTSNREYLSVRTVSLLGEISGYVHQ